ncbi:unnamed protein product [Thelazia callipaeda]|uniref:NR LBD domain-containing protein n=1 Tax=Thelazia callipaeda TaxID=103827 RepID=A0A0N5D090_THECL|nr:unnamed protein product [Thelazia callipaeda]
MPDMSSDSEITQKVTQTVDASCSIPKVTGDKKTRERSMRIARGHQIFKNIESTLCGADRSRKALDQEKELVRSYTRLRIKNPLSPVQCWSSEPHSSSIVTVDELMDLFDLAVSNKYLKFDELKTVLNDANLTLSDEDWSKFACHVANTAIQEIRGFAIDAAILAVGQKGFRSAFAQEVNILMSNYVFEEKAEQGVPELVAQLLIANWPRAHAHCDLESNDILFCIVSSIKGWLLTIIGETDEVEEVESSCACALYEVCRFAQRKLWMKWPELVDECYVAVKNAITLNITLTKEARKALLDTMIMMHEWTSRHAKTLVNESTQTCRSYL